MSPARATAAAAKRPRKTRIATRLLGSAGDEVEMAVLVETIIEGHPRTLDGAARRSSLTGSQPDGRRDLKSRPDTLPQPRAVSVKKAVDHLGNAWPHQVSGVRKKALANASPWLTVIVER